MTSEKKPYLSPAITEVKFEDKNLVLFLSCSKQTKIDGAITNGCCQLMPEMLPAASYDPS
jgi:hypothetical protein